MQKFSVFTVILASVLVVIVADFAINGYGQKAKEPSSEEISFDLPQGLDLSKVTETSVLGSDDFDFTLEGEQQAGASSPVDPDLEQLATDEFSSSSGIVYDEIPFSSGGEDVETSSVPDFEDEDYSASSSSVSQDVYLRDDQVQSSGFVEAYVQPEEHDGLLFKSVYVEDLYDVTVKKWLVRSDANMFAKVYVFTFGLDSGPSEVYEVLKVRASQGLNAEINETNSYAQGSFYMNDSRRQNTAFLIVKFDSLIYAFSYPKEYHPQIENLVTLLDLEF